MDQFSQFITNHWLLWLVFIVLLFLTFINDLVTQKRKAKSLSPSVVVDLINNEDAVIIDIRDKESFQTGHIINAVNASIDDFDKPKCTQYKNKKIILVCAKGLQAQSMATQITAKGYQPLVLNGGIEAWRSASLPLVKGKN